MALLFSLGIVLGILGLSSGTLYLWNELWGGSQTVLVPAGRYLWISGLALLIVAGADTIRRKQRLSFESLADPRPWALGLLLLFFSDWIGRPFGFFPSAIMRGELALGFLITLIVMRFRGLQLFGVYTVLGSAMLIWSFFATANGKLLFSDDHAMFMFRLQLLKENFPFIPFWSPVWNAGIDARDFFATGALNLFFIASPIVYLFDVAKSYNSIVAGLLWIFTPLCTYWAARLSASTRLASSLAALLAISNSLYWYRWGLKYGTMGFIVSTALFPLVATLGIRFVSERTLPWWRAALSLVALSLMLLWSPSGIALAPLFLIAIPFVPAVLRSPRHLVVIALIVSVNAPWMVMLWRVSAVTTFLTTSADAKAPPARPTAVASPLPLSSDTSNSLSIVTSAHAQGSSIAVETSSTSETPSPEELLAASALAPTTPDGTHAQGGVFRHKAGGLDLRQALKSWQETASAWNPLLLLLTVPGLLLLGGVHRAAYWVLSGWLLALGTVGVSLLPQLELDRMLTILSLFSCVPVGRLIERFFVSASREETPLIGRRLAVATIGAYVFVSPLCSAGLVNNRTQDHYSFASPAVEELTKVLPGFADGGRIVYTGCVIHEMSGGHLGPLALWSKTPMVASSYAHNIWLYEQVVPKSYIERDEVGIEEFLDVMNATVVLAHDPFWRKFLRRNPERYREIWRGESFVAFKRSAGMPTYFLEGAGTIDEQTSHSIRLTPSTSQVVIKFKYFPFLRSSTGTISKKSIAPEIDLIQLDGLTPGIPITIDSIRPLNRLFLRAKR